MVTDRLSAGREAFTQQDWKNANAELLAAAEADAQIGVEDLERVAISASLLGKDEAGADFWARAMLSRCIGTMSPGQRGAEAKGLPAALAFFFSRSEVEERT
jgi:hypothetical protein